MSLFSEEPKKSLFPADVTAPSCPRCGAVMQLARTQPAYFYERVQERTYSCECGETDTRFVADGQ